MRKGIFLILLFFTIETANAQFKWEVGFLAGASNYQGELSGKNKPRGDFVSDINLRQTRWDVGGFVRHKISSSYSIRATFHYLRITGADSLSTYPNYYYRNLHFRNNIAEFSTQLEYNFFRHNDNYFKKKKVNWSVYRFLGFGIYYHNPEAKSPIDGKWYALQPLGTEGQGRIDGTKKYNRLQFCVPVGLGVNFTLSKIFRFGFEFSYRFTFTDYLDDVSATYPDPSIFDNDPFAANFSNPSKSGAPQNLYINGSPRGEPKNKDNYMTTQITVSYVLRSHTKYYQRKQKKRERHKRTIRTKF